MALVTVNGVSIRGISAAVPRTILDNTTATAADGSDLQRVVKSIGINQRRMAADDQCTSDMCVAAAQPLLAELGWDPAEISAVVLVTQTADYHSPASACIIQHRLGLPLTALAFDVTLGCSGYVYGLYILSSLMASGVLKRALLLAGETAVRGYSDRDMTGWLLNGDAGTVTALEVDPAAEPMTFDLNTDGSGAQHILCPMGSRHRLTEQSLVYEDIGNGNWRRPIDTRLNGMEVFAFAMKRVPETVSTVLSSLNVTKDEIDWFVFHQASHMILDILAKKIGVPAEKMPLSMDEYGNTSSATIPLTIVSRLKEAVTTGKNRMLLTGFGVGLSWGTAHVTIDRIVCPDIVEI